ncbi:MAG: hypothetical protein ABR567_23215 [Myxococcales bacterium]
MRALPVLLVIACSAAKPPPAPPGPPACDALPVLGKAEPTSLASDASGGLAIAGDFAGTMQAAAAGITSAGGTDVFVLRTNTDGSVRWLRQIGGPGTESASAVALFPNGDAVVVGAADGHCFAARLADADGRRLWTAQLPGDGESRCRAVSIDAKGEAWTTGYFSGLLSGNASKGMYDLFVVRFAGASGDAFFVRAIGGKGKELPRAIAALADGSALLGGQFGGEVDVTESDVDFGKGPVRSNGDYDGFLLKLQPDGKTAWVATFGDNGDDEINALLVGADGTVYASGHHQPAANYLGLNPHGVGNFTGIVLRYSRDGRGDWVRIFEGPSSTANHLAFDEKGRLWTAGVEHGLRLDDTVIEDAGRGDAYALAFDPNTGTPIGSRRWGSPAFDIARGVARIPGGIAVTGFTEGEMAVCGKPIGTAGERTAFVVWLRDL